MTENFNPYQPPKKSGPETQPGKRLSIWDWVLAVVLGGLALCVTFFSTCIGVALSFLASDFDMLVPIVVCLCFFFSIGIGYSAAANYLARKAGQEEGNVAGMQSFRLQRSYRKPMKLDQLLTGCGMGLMALIVLMPITHFLLDQLSETVRFSPETSAIAQLIGFIGAVGLSLMVGWWYWRRVSSR